MQEMIKKECPVKVFIVESHKITRIALKQALKEYSHLNLVGEAGNLVDALYYMDIQRPDVVLIDLTFLGEKGVETVLKIKEKYSQVKVIVISNCQDEAEVAVSLGAGASAYCLQDIAPESLAMVIKTVAKGAFWIDPGASAAAAKCFSKPTNVTSLRNYKTGKIFANLTEREYEVLRHLVAGKTNSEIAKELIVSVHTAKAHVTNILQKMSVNDRVQAAVKAVKANIV